MKGKIYDANFLRVDIPDDEKTDWYRVDRDGFDIYGSISDEALLTLRMPLDVAATVNKRVLGQSVYGAGVRLRFKTDSRTLSLKVEYGEGRVPSVCTAALSFGFDVYRLDDKCERFITAFVPPSEGFDGDRATYSKRINKLSELHTYTVNFPHYASVRSIILGVDKGASISRGEPYANEKPIVFYGSSITHGASASNPGNTYENFISHKYNYDYINLGFAGSACGEASMADYIAGLDMSIFVFDYDHNAKDAAMLERTHYPFYKRVREKNPTLPIIMISRPDFFLDEDASKERRAVICSTYQRAVSEGDKHVYFIDGERLFDGEWYHSCTVDGVHPNDLGFVRMADKIGSLINEIMTK